VSDLVALAPAAAPARGRADVRLAEPDEGAPELHLIGLRVEEALEVLDGWLDRALAAGRGEVRVVHGHGTGRLRDALRQHLRRHPAVATFRAGAPNEGGNGATVVTLKG
jgi:DNA mismatch repair protein MutS2